MKKIAGIILIFAIVVVGAFYVYNKQNDKKPDNSNNQNNNQEFICDNNQFKKSTGLIISEELKEKYNNQIKDLLNNEDENGEKYFNAAMLYRNIDDLENSCKMFVKSVELDPDNFLAFSALGTAYQEMQDYARAEKAFQKALEINPKHINTYSKLAFLYKLDAEKTKEEIIAFYEDAVIKTAGDVNLAREYASYLEEVKEYKKAVEIWEALVEREGDVSGEIKTRIEELKAK